MSLFFKIGLARPGMNANSKAIPITANSALVAQVGDLIWGPRVIRVVRDHQQSRPM